MNCFKHSGSMPIGNQEDLEDRFADLDTQESNVPNLNDRLASLNSDITALEYVTQDEDLPTCLTLDETNEGNWKKILREEAIADYSQYKKPALEEDDESSDEEDVQCTSTRSLDVAMTLSKDLLLFFIERGEEDAAEYQQKVISNMEDTKLKLTIKTRQRALHEFIPIQTDTSSST